MRIRCQEQFLKYVNATNDLKKLTEVMGVGYTEQKLASEILTLARKGIISKLKATMLLREYPQMIKFLKYEFGAKKVSKSK